MERVHHHHLRLTLSLCVHLSTTMSSQFHPQFAEANRQTASKQNVTVSFPLVGAGAPLTPEEQAAKKKRDRIVGGLIIAGAVLGLAALGSGLWMAHKGSKSSSSSVTKTVRTVNAA